MRQRIRTFRNLSLDLLDEEIDKWMDSECPAIQKMTVSTSAENLTTIVFLWLDDPAFKPVKHD